MPRLQAARGARPVEVAQRRLYLTFLGIAAVVAALDQFTKHLVVNELSDGSVITVIEGILQFRLTHNAGGAFGIGQEFPGLFLVASLVTLVIVLLLARNIREPSWAIPLGLVLGGGIGNLIDRIFRDTGGRVIDFVDLQVWPLFNVADSAIVLGVVVLFVLSFGSRRE